MEKLSSELCKDMSHQASDCLCVSYSKMFWVLIKKLWRKWPLTESPLPLSTLTSLAIQMSNWPQLSILVFQYPLYVYLLDI